MQYTHLGRTGLQVSRLCLGTMNFGPQTSEPDSHAIMDHAHEHGHQLLRHRQRLRRARAKAPRRSSVAGSPRAADGASAPSSPPSSTATWATGRTTGKLSALNIRRACDASLKRLQTDYIDLYQMHHVDRNTPWDEIWEAMEVLRQQGKVLYVGSSNFAGWHIAQAQEAATSRHFLGLVSEQSLYNLLTRCGRARGASRPRSTTASASSRGRRSPVGCSVACWRKEKAGSGWS